MLKKKNSFSLPHLRSAASPSLLSGKSSGSQVMARSNDSSLARSWVFGCLVVREGERVFLSKKKGEKMSFFFCAGIKIEKKNVDTHDSGVGQRRPVGPCVPSPVKEVQVGLADGHVVRRGVVVQLLVPLLHPVFDFLVNF